MHSLLCHQFLSLTYNLSHKRHPTVQSITIINLTFKHTVDIFILLDRREVFEKTINKKLAHMKTTRVHDMRSSNRRQKQLRSDVTKMLEHLQRNIETCIAPIPPDSECTFTWYYEAWTHRIITRLTLAMLASVFSFLILVNTGKSIHMALKLYAVYLCKHRVYLMSWSLIKCA